MAALTGGMGMAQASAGGPAKLPTYDVVTVRPNNQGPGSVRVSSNTDVLATTNTSLVDLLREAYHLEPDQISGGPKWVESARFDVHAKVLDTPAETLKAMSRDDRRRMLRDLLISRFHLKTHTEVKMLPVYELVVTKGGLKISEIAPEHKGDAFNGVSAGGMSIRNGNLIGHYQTMDYFAEALSGQVHRTVLNKTGAPGSYNFELTWTRDDEPANPDSTAPPLFTALEEQLGLKLAAAKGPVTTLVIDHADLPSEDEN
jgi:uncharacterized protein (TIGR03435 family)